MSNSPILTDAEFEVDLDIVSDPDAEGRVFAYDRIQRSHAALHVALADARKAIVDAQDELRPPRDSYSVVRARRILSVIVPDDSLRAGLSEDGTA